MEGYILTLFLFFTPFLPVFAFYILEVLMGFPLFDYDIHFCFFLYLKFLLFLNRDMNMDMKYEMNLPPFGLCACVGCWLGGNYNHISFVNDYYYSASVRLETNMRSKKGLIIINIPIY